MFGLQGPESYAYTSRSNCLEVQGIDDVADFRETLVRRYTFNFDILLIIILFPESHEYHWSVTAGTDRNSPHAGNHLVAWQCTIQRA